MSNFLIIVFCLLAGYLLRRFRVVKDDGFKAINTWVIYIGLPATSFKYLPDLYWDDGIIVALLAPALLFAGSYVFIKGMGKVWKFSKRTTHTLILISGLSNTSFVGFPLVATYFGEDKIKWAIINDQMTFFLLSTVGVVLALQANNRTGQRIPLSYLIKRVLLFPPLLGCIGALLIPRFVDLSVLNSFFTQLSATVSPLALFSIGMQLSLSFSRSELLTIGVSIFYKLLLGPVLILLLLFVFQWNGEVAQITAFEMFMPSLVATSMVLQEFRLNTKLGNSIIGFSIVIGLITTWLAYQAIIVLL